jgi:hypothetical protein
MVMMTKKERYLKIIKNEIRKNTYRLPIQNWSVDVRYSVGGVIPMTASSIYSFDKEIRFDEYDKEFFDNYISSNELFRVMYRRISERYGIKDTEELYHVMCDYYNWFLDNFYELDGYYDKEV